MKALWMAVVALAAAIPRTLPAQSSLATVVTEQQLSFGTMLPGVTETVTVQDGWRRASIRVEGSSPQAVRFIVPAALQGPLGNSIPLTFDGSSAAWRTEKSTKLTLFDPVAGTRLALNKQQDVAWIYLGALAIPAAQQLAGDYTATVTIVIAPPNM
jgi:hypothetical protein